VGALTVGFLTEFVISFFFFSSRRRHTRFSRDWSSDVCSSDLIVPAFEELEKYCKVKGIPFESRESIIKNPQIIKKYQQEVDKANENFGHWEMVKKFVLLPKEWTIDNGELTPKLSLKRKIILQKHEEEINKIYAE